MTFQEFKDKVVNQFEDPQTLNFNEDTVFKKVDTWDSLTAMSVQTVISDDYGIEVTNDELQQAETLKDLYNIVNGKL